MVLAIAVATAYLTVKAGVMFIHHTSDIKIPKMVERLSLFATALCSGLLLG